MINLNRLPIQQRLPVLMCVLLLSAIVIYGFANYYSLKEATLLLGKERLISINDQMANTMSLSAQGVKSTSNALAARSEVLAYLKSAERSDSDGVLGLLGKMRKDSSWVSAALLNTELVPLLATTQGEFNIPSNINKTILDMNIGAGTTEIGKLYQIDGKIYFPVISSVTKGGKISGYVIAWKMLLTNQKSLDQFRELIGSDANFYIGNAKNDVWTDLVRPISGDRFKTIGKKPATYTNSKGELMIARKEVIPHTSWMLITEFSQDSMLTGARGFVNWIVVIGILLIGAGFLMAWFLSRSITRPLKQLTLAATAIAEGDYHTPVALKVSQDDELGKLANAFNVMKTQVSQMHESLEKRIEERTAQLEDVNKELEAFSYSVSHDLRTPLRAINGYSVMLQEEYGKQLDAEGHRIVDTIMLNARMMGQLIDDLLAFARLSKKEMQFSTIDMQQMVQNVLDELLAQQPKDKYKIVVGTLTEVVGDGAMIKQLLLNIIGNAIKYSSKKEYPLIEIGCVSEFQQTTFYVRDNGAGFNSVYSAKMFGVFQRLHSQQEFEGTGVGLALVKRILDKHNGTIRAEGLTGLGATFYFSLPQYNDDKNENKWI